MGPKQQHQQQPNSEMYKGADFLCLLQTPIGEYSLRDLRDAVQNIQLHWCGSESAKQIPAVEVENIDELVDACFRRFGELASGAGWPPEIMNDQVINECSMSIHFLPKI